MDSNENEIQQKRYRAKLPSPMMQDNQITIFSILKQCIGKDLSKITMPVVFNEPLSILQRYVEYLEYSDLLSKAAKCQDPVDRMQYVAAFTVSGGSSNYERLRKPFNPLLGETFEFERDGCRVICEQVTHHPPVSVIHAISADYEFHVSLSPRIKFWGKSVEIIIKGTNTLKLKSLNEAYTWNHLTCCVHNIVFGKLWIEQYGTVEITNHNTGHRCALNMIPVGWFSNKEPHTVEAFIRNKDGKKLRFLYGKWTEYFCSTDIQSFEDYVKDNPNVFQSEVSSSNKKKISNASLDSNESGPSYPLEIPDEVIEIPSYGKSQSVIVPKSTLLWKAKERPIDSDQYFNFTSFAMTLNEMEKGMESTLCATDCRFRMDIRKMEEGDMDGAAEEKHRLEEKQRKTRKAKKELKPRWFKLSTNPYTKKEDWLYVGGYWDRNYKDVPDIY